MDTKRGHNIRYRADHQGNYLIHDSQFFNLLGTTSGGGAILITISNSYVVIERCIFISCSAPSGNGGAIDLESTSSSFVINKVGGFDCYLTASAITYGQFALIRTKSNLINEVNFVSVSFSSPITRSTQSTLFLWQGNQKIISSNISYSQCHTHSSLDSYDANFLDLLYSSLLTIMLALLLSLDYLEVL